MSGPELKPCPFCGVRPHIHDDASHSTAFFVDCYNDNCTIQPSAYGLSKAEAIAAWNTRAPVTVQDAARVMLTAREQGQIDVEAVKLFLKGQPVAALRAIAESKA